MVCALVPSILLTLILTVASTRPSLDLILDEEDAEAPGMGQSSKGASLTALQADAAGPSGPGPVASTSDIRAVVCLIEDGKPTSCSDDFKLDEAGKQAVDLAGSSSSAACDTKITWARFNCYLYGIVVPTKIQGTDKYCCLCPPGKRYGLGSKMCETLPPFSTGVVFAGRSPEAACRAGSLNDVVLGKLPSCPKTATSWYRKAVNLPGIFPGKDVASCCLCPENSFYKEANCWCKPSDEFGEFPPVNGQCPQQSADSYVSAQGKHPAKEQIDQVRTDCLKHRLADELLDPATYQAYAIRLIVGPPLSFPVALAIEKLGVLDLNAQVAFDRLGDDVLMELIDTAKLTVRLRNVVIHTGAIRDLHFADVNVSGEVSGKELLSQIGETGSHAGLKVEIKREKKDWLSSLKDSLSIESKFADEIMKKIIVGIFTAVGKMCREFSVEGQLKPLMSGRSAYPMRLGIRALAECAEDRLCLATSLEAGESQEAQTEDVYEFKTLHVGVVADAEANAFETNVSGLARPNTRRALEERSHQSVQAVLDAALGALQGPAELPAESGVGAAGASAARAKDCKSRLVPEARKAAVQRFAEAAVKASGRLADIAEAVQTKFAQTNPDYPYMPGEKRASFEAKLFGAWQDKNKGQQVISFTRTHHPSFKVTSIKHARFKAKGNLTVRKTDDSYLSVVGRLTLESAMLENLRSAVCANPGAAFAAFSKAGEAKDDGTTLGSCWKDSSLTGGGMNVGVEGNKLSVYGLVGVSGEIMVCAEIKNEIRLNAGGWAAKAANWASELGAAASILEDLIEAKLADVLERQIAAKQRAALQLLRGELGIGLNMSDEVVEVTAYLSTGYRDLGRVQARGASAGAQPEPSPKGAGSAWQVLEQRSVRKFAEQFDGTSEARELQQRRLLQAREKFTYDPLEWMNIGKNSIISEVAKALNMTGEVDFGKTPSVNMTGTMTLNLREMALAKATDRGMRDYGQYRTASGKIEISTKAGKFEEKDAVLSCGYLFLGTSGNRLTTSSPALVKSALRFEHLLNFAAKESEEGYIERPAQSGCEPGHEHLRGLAGSSFWTLCVPEKGPLWTAIQFDLIKRDEMKQMVAADYSSGMQWSSKRPYFKLGPFQWSSPHALGVVIVQYFCKREVRDCERTLSCLSVLLVQPGDCQYLSADDIKKLKDDVRQPKDATPKGSYSGILAYKEYAVGLPETWGTEEQARGAERSHDQDNEIADVD